MYFFAAAEKLKELAKEHTDRLVKREYNRHAKLVLKPGEYGGSLELVALARGLGVRFIVYSLNQGTGVRTGTVDEDCSVGAQLIPELGGDDLPALELYLKFLSGDDGSNHYDSVVDIDYDARDCLLCRGKGKCGGVDPKRMGSGAEEVQ